MNYGIHLDPLEREAAAEAVEIALNLCDELISDPLLDSQNLTYTHTLRAQLRPLLAKLRPKKSVKARELIKLGTKWRRETACTLRTFRRIR